MQNSREEQECLLSSYGGQGSVWPQVDSELGPDWYKGEDTIARKVPKPGRNDKDIQANLIHKVVSWIYRKARQGDRAGECEKSRDFGFKKGNIDEQQTQGEGIN